MAKMNNFGFMDLTGQWPRFDTDADKYGRGVVGLATGSERYPGAGVLSVLGALNCGAGFVRYCGPESVRAALLTRAPSVTFGAGRVDAWVAGCGWDEEDDTNQDRWWQICQDAVPVVVDADALSLAADRVPDGSLMTPHAGELARLLDVERSAIEEDPPGRACEAARLFQCVVLLKGHAQFVATPEGTVTQIQEGSPWLARAGSGDVLAGMAGTLLAQTHDPELAGLLAAGMQAYLSIDCLHLGPYPPDRMAEFLPGVIGQLERTED